MLKSFDEIKNKKSVIYNGIPYNRKTKDETFPSNRQHVHKQNKI